MINRFEALGIAFSIGAMALALFLLRVETTQPESVVAVEGDDQVATVVVSEQSNERDALGSALGEAVGDSGKIEKLIIDDVIVGDGAEVVRGDTISVHYVGALRNGQQFDNSYERGAPFTFTVGEGRVITGWEEGVLGMQEGGQRVLVIPSDYGYGDNGFGPIPGGATLVFQVELLEIN